MFFFKQVKGCRENSAAFFVYWVGFIVKYSWNPK